MLDQARVALARGEETLATAKTILVKARPWFTI